MKRRLTLVLATTLLSAIAEGGNQMTDRRDDVLKEAAKDQEEPKGPKAVRPKHRRAKRKKRRKITRKSRRINRIERS